MVMRRLPFLPFILMASLFGFGLSLGFILGSFWKRNRQDCARDSEPQTPPPATEPEV